HAHSPHSEPETAMHAEEMPGAMPAALRPTGAQGHCERKKERPPNRCADAQLTNSALEPGNCNRWREGALRMGAVRNRVEANGAGIRTGEAYHGMQAPMAGPDLPMPATPLSEGGADQV